MSLYGSVMGDVEDDPFFGSHMMRMRQMNDMMNMFSHPFGMLGGGGSLAIGGPRHGGALMPFMPQMPSMNSFFSGLNGGHMGAGSTFSRSTVVMSNGPNGKPLMYSSSSSTQIGPNGVKETRKTLQDSLSGTKKMSIGHHIGERAHVIEREQNVYSGDAEERQEFINLDEEEAEDFDKEFQEKSGTYRSNLAIAAAPRREPARLALPAPPMPNVSEARRPARPAARRPLRPVATPIAGHSASVRSVYGGPHPARQRARLGRPHGPRPHPRPERSAAADHE